MPSITSPNVDKLKSNADVEGLLGIIMHQEDDQLRRDAIAALGELGDAPAVDALISVVRDCKASERITATYALGNAGETAIAPLIELLGERKIPLWNAALRALEIIGKPAVEYLTPLFGGERSGEVITLLEKIGDPSAVEPLLDFLDADEGYANKICLALGKLGDSRAVEPIIAVLKNSTDFRGRSAAARALGQLGDPRAIEPLISALRDEHQLVRSRAADALGRVGKDAVIPLLSALEDENKEVRSSAADALAITGDARAVEPVIAVLGVEVALTRALRNGNAGFARLLIDSGAETEWSKFLMEEAILDHTSSVELLLDLGADASAVNERTGLNALHTAVQKSCYETVRMLVEKGADVNARQQDVVSPDKIRIQKMNNSKAALSDAAAESIRMVQLLIELGADVDVQSTGGYTPLMVAAGRGKTDIVKELLEAGANTNIKSKNGETALGIARKKGYSETAAAIKEHAV